MRSFTSRLNLSWAKPCTRSRRRMILRPGSRSWERPRRCRTPLQAPSFGSCPPRWGHKRSRNCPRRRRASPCVLLARVRASWRSALQESRRRATPRSAEISLASWRPGSCRGRVSSRCRRPTFDGASRRCSPRTSAARPTRVKSPCRRRTCFPASFVSESLGRISSLIKITMSLWKSDAKRVTPIDAEWTREIAEIEQVLGQPRGTRIFRISPNARVDLNFRAWSAEGLKSPQTLRMFRIWRRLLTRGDSRSANRASRSCTKECSGQVVPRTGNNPGNCTDRDVLRI